MKKDNKNKGFTLIEIVVAIAVLAIAITPILTSFVTSAKLNVKSQKLMAATNIEQSIMEGFADKTYIEVLNICKKNGAGLSGKYIFSTVSNNGYNDSAAWVNKPADFTELTAKAGATNTPAKISYAGFAAQPTNQIYVPDSDSSKVYAALLDGIQDYFGLQMYASKQAHKTDIPLIGWWTDSKETVLAMYYQNVSEGGFKFDAIVVFVPGAASDDDVYYPYYVNIYLYSGVTDMYYDKPFMTYSSGIKNVSQKGSTER